LENEVVFDDVLREQADKEGIFKFSDVRYYIYTAIFLGVGYFVIKKFGK